MKRVNYHINELVFGMLYQLTEKQIEALTKYSESTGLSVAELIRRAIDAWLKKERNKNSQVN